MFDAETLRFTEVNHGACENLRYTMKELQGLTPLDLKPEFTPESFEKLIEPLREGNQEKIVFTTVHRRKDGTQYPVEVHLQLLSNVTPVFAAIILDITERRHAEEVLRESEQRFHSLVESAPDGIIVGDETGKIAIWNKGAQKMFGYQDDEIIGQPIAVLMPESYRQHHQENMKKLQKTGISKSSGEIMELEGLRKDGDVFPIELSLSKWRSKDHDLFGGICRDITERKLANKALEVSEKQLRLSTEMASVAVWEYDFIENRMTRSANHDKLYGMEPQDEWVVDTFLNATHPDDRDRSKRTIQESIKPGGSDYFGFDFRVIWPDESVHWLSVAGQIVKRDLHGTGIDARGCLIDITERKQSEEKNRLLSQAIEQSPVSVVITNTEANIEFVNTAFENVTGYRASEVIGRNPRFMKSGKTPKNRYQELWQTITCGKLWQGELQNKKKNGEIFWEYVQIAPVHR